MAEKATMGKYMCCICVAASLLLKIVQAETRRQENSCSCGTDRRYYSRPALLTVRMPAAFTSPLQTSAWTPEVSLTPCPSRTLQDTKPPEVISMTTTPIVTPTVEDTPSLINPPTQGLSITLTASVQTIPLHPSEAHSQPTTNITAAAITEMIFPRAVTMTTIVTAIPTVEDTPSPINPPTLGWSTTVTVSMQTIPLHHSETHSQPTTNITATAVAEMTPLRAITMTTTVTLAPTVQITPHLTKSPTPGVSLVEKIAIGVSVTLYIIITAVIVLLMVCCFLHWKYSSDENTPTTGLLSKLVQPELNNFTTPHPSAVVMEPLETRAVPTGMNQASEHETEIAVADAPSQRKREESRPLSRNDTSKNTISTVGTLV